MVKIICVFQENIIDNPCCHMIYSQFQNKVPLEMKMKVLVKLVFREKIFLNPIHTDYHISSYKTRGYYFLIGFYSKVTVHKCAGAGIIQWRALCEEI